MEIIREYVDTVKYLESLENDLVDKLHELVGLRKHRVKSVSVRTFTTANEVKNKVIIELIGQNEFKSEDVAKIKGLTIVTPNQLEIDAGVVYL